MKLPPCDHDECLPTGCTHTVEHPLAAVTGSPLTRTVTLTLSEHVLLVRTIRERAYSMRLLARTTFDAGLSTNALDAAERLEARADELANAKRLAHADENL